jgi:DNA-binding XRE family transcriptional regulator
MKINEAAFAQIERHRKFSKLTLEIGRRRILRKERAADLASTYGVNQQRIYAIETQILAASRALRLPPGWDEVTLVAPKELIREFRRKAEAARDQLTKARSQSR